VIRATFTFGLNVEVAEQQPGPADKQVAGPPDGAIVDDPRGQGDAKVEPDQGERPPFRPFRVDEEVLVAALKRAFDGKKRRQAGQGVAADVGAVDGDSAGHKDPSRWDEGADTPHDPSVEVAAGRAAGTGRDLSARPVHQTGGAE